MRVSIVYDGLCPVCNRVVHAARLRERSSELELIDARHDDTSAVQGTDLSGVDFNQGFCVVVDGEAHLGAEAAFLLSGLTERTGIFYRFFQLLSATDKRSRLFYPLLRTGRNLLLWLLRIPKIDTLR